MLRHFFTKPERNQKKARWFEFLGSVGLFKPTLLKGRNNVLGDALSSLQKVVLTPETTLNAFTVETLAIKLLSDLPFNY